MFHVRSGIIWRPRGLDSVPQLKLRRGSVEECKLNRFLVVGSEGTWPSIF